MPGRKTFTKQKILLNCIVENVGSSILGEKTYNWSNLEISGSDASNLVTSVAHNSPMFSLIKILYMYWQHPGNEISTLHHARFLGHMMHFYCLVPLTQCWQFYGGSMVYHSFFLIKNLSPVRCWGANLQSTWTVESQLYLSLVATSRPTTALFQ